MMWRFIAPSLRAKRSNPETDKLAELLHGSFLAVRNDGERSSSYICSVHKKGVNLKDKMKEE
jgi:hypothetical protein